MMKTYQFISQRVILVESAHPRYQDNGGYITIGDNAFETHLDFFFQEGQIVCRELNVPGCPFDDLNEIDTSPCGLEPERGQPIECIALFGGTIGPGGSITKNNEPVTVDLCKWN